MEFKIELKEVNFEILRTLFGNEDRNLQVIEMHFKCHLVNRGDNLLLNNCDQPTYQHILGIIETMIKMIKSGYALDEREVMQLVILSQSNNLKEVFTLHNCVVGRSIEGKVISPKTIGQLNYINSLKKYDINFGIGPAGTGKTYLAVVHAVTCLKNNEVKRIVLTRPAVEAGENLGFLPGDLKEKVDPYLRPLYDALDDMLGKENVEKYIEKGIIEIAPLAYMRGRTLEDAYVILDEAQNATISQIKMFLTRLGFHSKMVITGDITQVDLKGNLKSGLISVEPILKSIPEIAFIHLSSKDVVRHPLVQSIIDAYEEAGF